MLLTYPRPKAAHYPLLASGMDKHFRRQTLPNTMVGVAYCTLFGWSHDAILALMGRSPKAVLPLSKDAASALDALWIVIGSALDTHAVGTVTYESLEATIISSAVTIRNRYSADSTFMHFNDDFALPSRDVADRQWAASYPEAWGRITLRRQIDTFTDLNLMTRRILVAESLLYRAIAKQRADFGVLDEVVRTFNFISERIARADTEEEQATLASDLLIVARHHALETVSTVLKKFTRFRAAS